MYLQGLGVANNETSRALFMLWLKREHPNVYAVVKKRAPQITIADTSAVHGLGTNNSSSWADVVLNVVKGVVPMVQQQKIFKAQLDRAKQGLPPLKTEELAPPGVPIKVELPASVQREVTGGLVAGKNMMMLAVVGGLGLLLFGMISRRKGK